MGDFEQAAELTTDRLLSCVADVLEAVDVTDKLPSRAILIYETLETDGGRQIDFVTTRDLGSTDIVGMAHFVREAILMDMFADE